LFVEPLEKRVPPAADLAAVFFGAPSVLFYGQEDVSLNVGARNDGDEMAEESVVAIRTVDGLEMNVGLSSPNWLYDPDLGAYVHDLPPIEAGEGAAETIVFGLGELDQSEVTFVVDVIPGETDEPFNNTVSFGIEVMSEALTGLFVMLDVNDDGNLSPLDVLEVIAGLNTHGVVTGIPTNEQFYGSTEPEPDPDPPPPDPDPDDPPVVEINPRIVSESRNIPERGMGGPAELATIEYLIGMSDGTAAQPQDFRQYFSVNFENEEWQPNLPLATFATDTYVLDEQTGGPLQAVEVGSGVDHGSWITQEFYVDLVNVTTTDEFTVVTTPSSGTIDGDVFWVDLLVTQEGPISVRGPEMPVTDEPNPDPDPPTTDVRLFVTEQGLGPVTVDAGAEDVLAVDLQVVVDSSFGDQIEEDVIVTSLTLGAAAGNVNLVEDAVFKFDVDGDGSLDELASAAPSNGGVTIQFPVGTPVYLNDIETDSKVSVDIVDDPTGELTVQLEVTNIVAETAADGIPLTGVSFDGADPTMNIQVATDVSTTITVVPLPTPVLSFVPDPVQPSTLTAGEIDEPIVTGTLFADGGDINVTVATLLYWEGYPDDLIAATLLWDSQNNGTLDQSVLHPITSNSQVLTEFHVNILVAEDDGDGVPIALWGDVNPLADDRGWDYLAVDLIMKGFANETGALIDNLNIGSARLEMVS